MSSPGFEVLRSDEGDVGGPFEMATEDQVAQFLEGIAREFAASVAATEWRSAEEPTKAEEFVDDMN
jgi:hypothetical protein